MDRLALFLDTNIYLHYIFFTDIPWNEILGAEDICLIISPITFGEIEKRKFGSQPARIRDRAAAVARKLDALSESAAEVRPRVGIEFLHVEPAEFDSYQLSRESQDDQLIASILQFKKGWGPKIHLITADGGMRRKSLARGIDATRLSDEYLLKEEDASERKITELQKKLNELQSLSPRLSLRFENGSNYCAFQRPPAPPAEPSWEDVERIKEKHPHLWQGPLDAGQLMNAFRQLSVDRFSEHEYNSALDEFYLRHEQYLQDSYKIDELKSRSLTLNVEVFNSGTLPAEDIRVLVKIPSPLDLCDSDEFSYPKKPAPPRKPQPGTYPNISDLVVRPYPPPFNAADLSRAMEPRRVRWLGLSQENDFKVATFEVQKLNHSFSEKCPHAIIVIFENRDAIHSFTIEFKITAANIPDKEEGQLHVIIAED